MTRLYGGPRVVGTLLAFVGALAVAPVLAGNVTVWRWPTVPDKSDIRPGTVGLVVSVLGAEGWIVVDGVVVAPAVCAVLRQPSPMG